MTPRALAVLRRMLETPDESFRQHFQDVSDDRDRIAMSGRRRGDEVHLAIAYNRIIWRAAA
jgi:Tol biopolymer transport system component